MPEEKVGKRVHPDSCLRYPPAADAGPRHYTNRHGEPCSQACGEGRHAECTEDLTTCNCTYRGLHKTPHCYATYPYTPPVPQEPSETLKQMTVNNLPQGAVGVPQEAAPRLTAERIAEIVRTPLSRQESIAMMTEDRDAKHTRKLALSEIPGSMLNDGITEVEVAATAPDRAMRLAKDIYQKCVMEATDELWMDVAKAAALIREAGSWELNNEIAKKEDWKRLAEANQQTATKALKLVEAGSERERELRDGLEMLAGLGECECDHSNNDCCVIANPRTCVRCEASRLLIGESK